MIYISRHDGNVTTTVPINTAQRFLFAVGLAIAGLLLIHYSILPIDGGRILIGALMIALAFVILFGAVFWSRRARR